MHLLLSSCDFSNDASRRFILDHLPVKQDQCRILFVPNEKATSEKIRSGKYHARLASYGFCYDNIYVFDPVQADNFIGLDLDAIYVSGGNTFLTLRKIRECGFDRELIRYIQNGVIYIGGSAGAHLVTENIEHVAEYDEVPSDMSDYSALGMFHGILLCHYTSQRKPHYDRLMADDKYLVVTLTDEESLEIYE